MTMSEQHITTLLTGFNQRCAGVQASCVVLKDGYMIATAHPEQACCNEDRVAILSSAVAHVGHMLVKDELEGLDWISLSFQSARLLIMPGHGDLLGKALLAPDTDPSPIATAMAQVLSEALSYLPVVE